MDLINNSNSNVGGHQEQEERPEGTILQQVPVNIRDEPGVGQGGVQTAVVLLERLDSAEEGLLDHKLHQRVEVYVQE